MDLSPKDQAIYDAAMATQKPKPSESGLSSKFRVSGGGRTANIINEMMAAMSKEEPSPRPFDAPTLSSGAMASGPSKDYSAKDALAYEKYMAAANATSFKDLIPSKEELAAKLRQMVTDPKRAFLTEPSEGAKTIREFATSFAPTAEEIAAKSQENPSSVPYGAIALRGAADVAADAVPITPTEIAGAAIGGKLIGMAGKPMASLATNFVKGAESGALRAGLPYAEQEMARLGFEIGAQPSGKELGKGLVQGIPRVSKEIKALARSIKNTEEPIKDILMSPFHPDAPIKPTISEIQAKRAMPEATKAPIPIPGKNIFEIQKAASSNDSLLASAVADAKQWARERINVDKGMRTPEKTNLHDLVKAQETFDTDAALNDPTMFIGLRKWIKGMGHYTASGWAELDQAGPVGQRLATLGRAMLNNSEQRKGRALQAVDDIFNDLSQVETDNLMQVANSGAQPKTNKVRIAAAALREMTDNVAKEASRLLNMKNTEGQVVPWEPIKNFFPHVMDTAETEAQLALKGTSGWKQFIKDYADKNFKGNIREAEEKIVYHLNRKKAGTYGNLEQMRKFDSPFYIKDPRRAYKEYFSNVFRRLESAKAFGNQNQKGLMMLNELKDDRARKVAGVYLKDLVGVDPQTEAITLGKQAIGPLTKFTSKMMMSGSQILNSTQGLFGAPIEGGIQNLVRALPELITPSGFKGAMHDASRSGAVASDVVHEAGKLMESEFAKNTGFSATEIFNRVLSNTVGKHRAAEFMANLRTGKDLSFTLRKLHQYGINASEIQKRGHMTEYEIDRIGKSISDISQGRTRIIDMPLGAEEPYARILYHMRAFPFQWSRFMKQGIYDELKKGNPTPMITALSIAPFLGEIPASITEGLGRKRMDKLPLGIGSKRLTPEQNKWLARRLDAILILGGAGIVQDVASGVIKGKSELFTPPSASVLMKGTQAVADLGAGAMGEPRGKTAPAVPITKYMLRNVLPVGLAKLPPQFAIPAIMLSRRAGAVGDKIVPAAGTALSTAIQSRLGKKSKQ